VSEFDSRRSHHFTNCLPAGSFARLLKLKRSKNMSLTFQDALWVAAGGALGAVARYWVSLVGRTYFVPLPGFPWVTFAVNGVGCLLAGMLLGWVDRSGLPQRQWVLLGGVGFLGSFTTFSAFAHETWLLLRDGEPWTAIWSVFSNVVLGVLAAGLGRWWAGAAGY
jgi:CrcB protein